MRHTKIFLVENDPTVAENIGKNLTRLGYDVCEVVPSYREALQEVQKASPDAVLMDARRPEEEAIQAATQIRDEFDIPVIYLMDNADDGTLKRFNVTEPYDYVLKPFGNRELHLAIESALYKHYVERRLARNETEKAAILNNMSELVAYQDTEHRILWANRAASDSVGSSPQELMGRRCYEIWHGRSEPCEQCPVAKTRETGRPQQGKVSTPDGRSWLVKGYPVKDAEGGVVSIIVVTLDITARKKAEEALEESEERFRLLLEHSVDGINICEGSIHGQSFVRKIVFCNDRFVEMSGFTREELMRCSNLDNLLISRIPTEEHEKQIEQLRNGLPYRGISSWKRPDGKENYHEWVAVPLKIGGKLYTMGIDRDITERKRIEEKLRETQKMEAVGRLAGGIAHDFNNLLMGIMGYTDLLLRNVENAEIRSDLSEIRKLADRGADLVRQLMAFGRKQILEFANIDLNELVADLCVMLRRVIGEHIDLHFVPGDDVGCVRGDAGQLEHVIINIAINARDAMPNGGEITIKTERVTLTQDSVGAGADLEPGDYVRILVSDTGPGIEEEILPHIFDPFYTTKEFGQGAGLGLATVYGIVKQHGGHIVVETEQGRGTTFHIYLPHADVEPESPAKTAAQRFGPRGTETILVVEDEDTVRDVTGRMLEHAGYTVLRAANPAEAERVFAERGNDVDLLLSDVVMPQCSGRELYKRLAARHSSLKVLFMSGYDDDSSVLRSAELSRAPLICKPFDRSVLTEKVRDVLDA